MGEEFSLKAFFGFHWSNDLLCLELRHRVGPAIPPYRGAPFYPCVELANSYLGTYNVLQWFVDRKHWAGSTAFGACFIY